MASTSKTSPTAMFPFNSPDKADLVVRSADGVHFFVAKCFLIYNSEFFANLLADSLPEETHEGLPMFVAAEHSITMCIVLQLCYPFHGPVHEEGLDIMGWPAVRDALRKYMMEVAEASFLACISSVASRMMKADPQRSFVIARWAGLDDVARAAAQETLRHPFHDREAFEELALVSGLEHRRLCDYFRSCGKVVSQKLSPATLHPKYPTFGEAPLDSYCTCGKLLKSESSEAHSWVINAIQESQRLVREARSAGFLEEASCDRLFFVACKSCSSHSPECARAVMNAINEEVARLVSEVEYPFE